MKGSSCRRIRGLAQGRGVGGEVCEKVFRDESIPKMRC